MKLKGVFLSKRQDWRTPKHVIRQLTFEFGELYDPCPSNPSFDGLTKSFPLDKWTYINPPFNKLKFWSKKIFDEVKRGSKVILLMPARTDTRYFHDWLLPNAKEIRFIKGRLCFDDSKKGSPFPTIEVIMYK